MPDTQQHFSVDGFPIEVDAQYWNNDLRVVKITDVATHSNPYADTGETQTWHQTGAGQFDTLSGGLRRIGRLVRWFEGKDAATFAPGTYYGDVK